jgi:hypothetical protein
MDTGQHDTLEVTNMNLSHLNTTRYMEIAAGLVPKLSAIYIAGRNPDVDTGTDPEDVWNAASTGALATQTQTYMTVADALFVSSSAAANDDDQIIAINGLDENWDNQTVNVTPNNQVQVIVPQGNYSNTYVLTFAALVAGPPVGTVITQAVTGNQLRVTASDTTLNTISGYLITGTPDDLVNGFVDPTGTMNPDPNVPTAIDAAAFWLRVNAVSNISANALNGDLYVCEGDTLAAGLPTTAAALHAKIDIGKERAQGTSFSVPRNHTAYLLNGFVSNDTFEDSFARIAIQKRDFGQLFQTFTEIGTRGFASIDNPSPFAVAGRADIKMVCTETEADNTGVSAGYQLILRDMSPPTYAT